MGSNLPSFIFKWDLAWDLDSCQAALLREVVGEANVLYVTPTTPAWPWKALSRTLGIQGTQLRNHEFSPICSFYKWETEAQIRHKTDP